MNLKYSNTTKQSFTNGVIQLRRIFSIEVQTSNLDFLGYREEKTELIEFLELQTHEFVPGQEDTLFVSTHDVLQSLATSTAAAQLHPCVSQIGERLYCGNRITWPACYREILKKLNTRKTVRRKSGCFQGDEI